MTGLLTAAYGGIKKTLEQLDNKLELGLKVIWKKEALANKLEQDYEDLKYLKEEIMGLPSDSAYGPAIILGQRVEAAMEEMQSFYQEQIYPPLQAISLDARLNKPLNERMILNAAFLVSRDQETGFDAKVNELYEQHHEEFNFMYSGPWPPYNFIDLKLEVMLLAGGKAMLLFDNVILAPFRALLEMTEALSAAARRELYPRAYPGRAVGTTASV